MSFFYYSILMQKIYTQFLDRDVRKRKEYNHA
jgi:hypothetical protein